MIAFSYWLLAISYEKEQDSVFISEILTECFINKSLIIKLKANG